MKNFIILIKIVFIFFYLTIDTLSKESEYLKDGVKLFQDGDKASLRREVEASILEEIQLAMISAGADKEVKEAKADLKSK